MELVKNFATDNLQFAQETSSLGEVYLTFADDLLLELLFQPWQTTPANLVSTDFSRHLASLVGTRNADFRYGLRGTDFQQQVWQALLTVPWGQTCSYSELAQQIGRPKAVRAVANAVGANPISWFIPCHRILRQNGDLGGFRWGSELKQKMLQLETLN